MKLKKKKKRILKVLDYNFNWSSILNFLGQAFGPWKWANFNIKLFALKIVI